MHHGSQCPRCVATDTVRGIGYEQIELQAKLLDYFLGSNKSNINQRLQPLRLVEWQLRLLSRLYYAM